MEWGRRRAGPGLLLAVSNLRHPGLTFEETPLCNAPTPKLRHLTRPKAAVELSADGGEGREQDCRSGSKSTYQPSAAVDAGGTTPASSCPSTLFAALACRWTGPRTV